MPWLLWVIPLSGQVVLTDVTESTGITFRHTDGGSGKHYIVEYVSAGLALFDYDGAGGLTQTAEVHSGRSYQSHYGLRLHFGLGRRDRVDRIEVHWLGGGVDVLRARPPQ